VAGVNLCRNYDLAVSPKNGQAPIISVLLPVYNAENYLHDAVDSVLSQTFPDFELLILDDGSTDRSASILREYESKDRRVRHFSRENLGLIPTLNELIGRAQGRYLARMDADDVCLPQRFERQMKFLDSHEECVLVGSFHELINSLDQPIGTVKHPLSHEEIDGMHLKGICCVTHSSVMLRSAIVKQLNGYDIRFDTAEDLELWLRLAERGKLANIPEVMVKYRIHAESVSERFQAKQRNTARMACETAWARRGISGVFEADEVWRRGRDKQSRYEFANRYGWIAWSNNHRGTWWTYTKEAIRLRPFAISSWRLLVFGLLRRPIPTARGSRA
jgi:glycosyltransferase involved in cell wall biosynthesis